MLDSFRRMVKSRSSQLRVSVGKLLYEISGYEVGKSLYKVSGKEERLKYLTFYDGAGRKDLQAWLSRCVQHYVLKEIISDGRDPNTAASSVVLEESLGVSQHVSEFEEVCAKLQYQEAGILNTEGLVLWALIRRVKPSAYFESGTGRGYSTRIAAEALLLNHNSARLYTFGVDDTSSMDAVRKRLAIYRFCEIIEGESQKEIALYLERHINERVAVFVDGPKGSSPAFLALLNLVHQHSEPLFVAIHDCEAHLPWGFDPQGKWPNGRINPTRSQLEYFYQTSGIRRTYKLYFMDNAWCERYEYLNNSIYDLMPDFAPYQFKKSRQVSHSTILGILLHRAIDIEST